MSAATKLSRARLLTVPELADRLRISKRSAYRVARDMPHRQVRGRLFVLAVDVERYIEEHTYPPRAPSPWPRKGCR